ncbi:MAG: 16S rRNA (uracil(1498)-N(3))-methyltransferase [Anaplasma sp.]
MLPSKKKPVKIRLYCKDAGSTGVGGVVVLDGDLAHYVRDVMRAQLSEVVLLFDGVQGEWSCRVVGISRKAVEVEIEELVRGCVPTKALVLCFALVKGDVTRSIVRQATEMGVTLIQPIRTEYSSARDINLEKCRAWIAEASAQCRRQDIPNIAPAMNFSALRELHNCERQFVLCDETGAGGLPRDVLRNDKEMWVIIGPEGGFSHKELNFADGFCDKISLGSRILRVDTAVVAALSYANGHFSSS